MSNRQKKTRKPIVVAAVSGGPDSAYLLRKLSTDKGTRVVVGHVNYGIRGSDSEKDKLLVEKICKTYGYDKFIYAPTYDRSGSKDRGAQGLPGRFPPGFEKMAREIRYRFLKDLAEKTGADSIALAHTADDQVETILMRFFEGAGIGGLKGIPRDATGGIVRPILDVWKEDILGSLKKRKIPYRIDRSNFDTRFERNWVRHVLIPILVKRYGKSVKKRIHALGERFRELDDYIEGEAEKWIRRNLKRFSGRSGDRGYTFRRERYSGLPTVVRVKILQRFCFDMLGFPPNERLLIAMDRSIREGGPSAAIDAGKGWKLANRYETTEFLPAGNGKKDEGETSETAPSIVIGAPGEYEYSSVPNGRRIGFALAAGGKISSARAKRLAATGNAEVFDAVGLKMPLTIRPLRAGDRIRPFGTVAGDGGRDGEKKVKEILIDRKVPKEERWGRPVVCDAEGKILWIPGVLRSARAAVTPGTRETAVLRIRSRK